MKEDRILMQLDELPPSVYIRENRRGGRMKVPAEVRAQACRLFEVITHHQQSEAFLSAETARIFEVASRTFFSDWFLARNPKPRYQAYTNVRVLNWALQTHTLLPLNQVMDNAWRAIGVLIRDLRAFEVGAQGFELALTTKRVILLHELERQVPSCESAPDPALVVGAPRTWAEYACDPSRTFALADLSAFPQGAQHDEYLFLRIIHCSECCFWGVLSSVIGAQERAKSCHFAQGATILDRGVEFATFLVRLLEVLKTMTPETFRAFRDETGDASALQSRSYQRMQISLLGLDPAKSAFLSEVPELSDLMHFGHPNFIHLKKLIQTLETGHHDRSFQRFIASAHKLDEALFDWRRLHLGVARNYLSDRTGSGGTPGFAYLKSHYAHKVLASGPETESEASLPATGTYGPVKPLFGTVN